MTKERIYPHEWLAVLSLIIILFLLTFLSWCQSHTMPALSNEPHQLVSSTLAINIQGDVERPGVYEMQRGETVSDALKKAGVLSTANTQKIKPNQKLRPGQIIYVPKQEWIVVHLSGEVEPPTTFVMPKEATVADLWPLVTFTDRANKEKLPQKRRLKSGETLHIPAKKKKNGTKKDKPIEENRRV